MWAKLRAWVKDSETIAWARIQAVIGIAAAVVTYVDPQVLAPIIPHAWFPLFLVANGIATEYLRRRRAEDLK
jgi:hypothetical protein